MRPCRKILWTVAAGACLALCPRPLLAQTDVRLSVDEVDDDRYGDGPSPSSLEIKVRFTGDGMDGVRGVRFVLEDAHDDLGNSLLPAEPPSTDFEDPEGGAGPKITLKSPARKAAKISVVGKVELFAPKRDPNAIVTVEKALARQDAALVSTGLAAANVEVSILSRERWAEELKKQRPTEKDLAELRAEAKKKGASDEEIEAGIALLTGLTEALGEVPENGVILSGPRAGMELIRSVQVLRTDGEEIHVSSTARQGDQKTMTMILEPAQAPPPDASLRFTLLTEKARFMAPFALKDIPLP